MEEIVAPLVHFAAKLIGVKWVGYSGLEMWLTLKSNNRISYLLFSANTSISLRLSMMLLSLTLFIVVWMM